MAIAQDAPSERPITPPPDRTESDRYLWELAHHPDTLAAFEGFLHDGDKLNPWAWRVNRINAHYCSQVTFNEAFYHNLKGEYGNTARAELLRRQVLAEKLDHTLWELFQAVAVYNREAFMSTDHSKQLLAAEEAKPRRQRDDKLIERLNHLPADEKKWGKLPPARSRSTARSKPADSNKP